MGSVITTIELGDPEGRRFRNVELEADTGSTYTALPREMPAALGVPVQTSVESRLADGSIRQGGREVSTTVIFAEAGEPNLPGVIALEEALLAADPANGELTPVGARRYWPVPHAQIPAPAGPFRDRPGSGRDTKGISQFSANPGN